jgi:hypothetical protein
MIQELLGFLEILVYLDLVYLGYFELLDHLFQQMIQKLLEFLEILDQLNLVFLEILDYLIRLEYLGNYLKHLDYQKVPVVLV